MVKIGEFAQDIAKRSSGAGWRGSARQFSISLEGQGRRSWQERPMEGFGKSQVFPFQIRGLDIGDVDGDKKNELVIMDATNIYVFKYTGEKLTLFQKVEAGYENNFLTLDVVNVNRVGPAEIITTSVVEDNLRSLIIEFEEGNSGRSAKRPDGFTGSSNIPRMGPS